MSDVISVIQKIKTKELPPKIYAIVVDSPEGEGVTIVVGYTLEDACAEAKEEARKHLGGGDIRHYHVRHWSALDMETFKDRILMLDYPDKKKSPAVTPVGPKYKKEDINRLMKFVVEKNDKNLLDLLLKTSGITATEYKYLNDKIKPYGRKNSRPNNRTA
jgi:hypothetical protein